MLSLQVPKMQVYRINCFDEAHLIISLSLVFVITSCGVFIRLAPLDWRKSQRRRWDNGNRLIAKSCLAFQRRAHLRWLAGELRPDIGFLQLLLDLADFSCVSKGWSNRDNPTTSLKSTLFTRLVAALRFEPVSVTWSSYDVVTLLL